MKNLNYILVFAVAAIFSLTSCKNDKASSLVKGVENEAKTVINKANDGAVKINNIAEGPLTTAVAEGPDTFDFGTVEEGAIVEHTFKIKNTGDNPLVIKSAKSTCGCTVPEKPKEPIAPGEVGEIKVKFNTSGKGKRGGGIQLNKKPVTVTANTPQPIKFHIQGNVNKPASKIKPVAGPVKEHNHAH